MSVPDSAVTPTQALSFRPNTVELGLNRSVESNNVCGDGFIFGNALPHSEAPEAAETAKAVHYYCGAFSADLADAKLGICIGCHLLDSRTSLTLPLRRVVTFHATEPALAVDGRVLWNNQAGRVTAYF